MSTTGIRKCVAAIALLGCSWSSLAATTVVSFEDGAANLGTLEGYQGISGWDSLGSVTSSSGGTGIGDYYFHARSGELLFDKGPIIFEGFHYNRWSGPGVLPSYDLFYQGQLVFKGYVDTDAQPSDLYWVASGYSGRVDRIGFYAESDGIAFDNLTFTAAPVPEPLSSAMLLAGLVLVSLSVKKRKRFHFRPRR